MPYPYGMYGAPTVVNGLGGLPRKSTAPTYRTFNASLYTVYTVPGTYTFTVPANITKIHVLCIGGGGAGRSNLGAGNNGGASSFGAYLTANGGSGTSGSTGGAGGAGTTIALPNIGGGDGGAGGGSGVLSASQGGGGAGGYSGNGGTGGVYGVSAAVAGSGGGGSGGQAGQGNSNMNGGGGGGTCFCGEGTSGVAPGAADTGTGGGVGSNNFNYVVGGTASGNATASLAGTAGLYGGGGGARAGGGGGGGGLRYYNNIPVTPGQAITVTVGAGGTNTEPTANGAGGCVVISLGPNNTFPNNVFE